MHIKKWISLILISNILLVAFVLVFNYKVDSYGVFRSEYLHLYREPNRNFLKMDFLINHPNAFDSFIFGSSRVGIIDPGSLKNGHYYNMAYSEGLPLEHLNNIKLLLQKGVKIKNILLGLDEFSFILDPKAHTLQPLRRPHYLIENISKNKFYSYYLTLQPSKFDYKRIFKQRFSQKNYPYFVFYLHATGQEEKPEEIDAFIEKNTQEHISHPKLLEAPEYKGERIKATIQEIQEIVELSRKYDFKLYIFINPIHKTSYNAADLKNFNTFKKELAQISDYVDFATLNTITTNSYYYYEPMHYRENVAHLMMEKVFDPTFNGVPSDFGFEVTKNNVNRYLLK